MVSVKQITKNNQGNLGGGLGYETESKHGFEGQGTTSRAGTLQGRLTCRVLEVMRNGTLKVWGYKQVRSNRETQYLVVEGLARPLDIAADNTIQSSLLAEAKIDSTGQESSGTSKVLVSSIVPSITPGHSSSTRPKSRTRPGRPRVSRPPSVLAGWLPIMDTRFRGSAKVGGQATEWGENRFLWRPHVAPFLSRSDVSLWCG